VAFPAPWFPHVEEAIVAAQVFLLRDSYARCSLHAEFRRQGFTGWCFEDSSVTCAGDRRQSVLSSSSLQGLCAWMTGHILSKVCPVIGYKYAVSRLRIRGPDGCSKHTIRRYIAIAWHTAGYGWLAGRRGRGADIPLRPTSLDPHPSTLSPHSLTPPTAHMKTCLDTRRVSPGNGTWPAGTETSSMSRFSIDVGPSGIARQSRSSISLGELGGLTSARLPEREQVTVQ